MPCPLQLMRRENADSGELCEAALQQWISVNGSGVRIVTKM